ncbi:MAG TPA: transposase [Ignavibacteria bacterium]|nr:transposase [Ignavibacteria bacterium]
MLKFKNKYRIPTSRLKGWDYGSSGLYFITICTKNKVPYFGNIQFDEAKDTASIQKTKLGLIAENFWTEIPKHFAFVKLDEFIIMPNHIHGIIFMDKEPQVQWFENKFGPQSSNLASIIRSYKAAVKKYSTLNKIKFEWQERYYDHIIKSDMELENIRKYISENILKWTLDENYIKNE